MKIFIITLVLLIAFIWMRQSAVNDSPNIRYVAQREVAPPVERVRKDLEQRVAALPAPALELAELASLVLSEAQRTQSEPLYREAESLAERSLVHLSHQNPALLVLAKAAESRHDFLRAQSLALRSLKERDNVSAHMVLTTAALAQGDLVSALRHATLAVEAEPATATYLNRALVLTAAGRYFEGEFDFARALRLEAGATRAESARLRLLWGRHLLRKDELAGAGDLIEQGLVAAPDSRLGLQLKAEWSLAKKDWVGARRAIEASMAQGPAPRDLMLMARIFREQGKLKEGEEYRVQAEAQLRKELIEGRYGHRLELVQALLLGDKGGSTMEALGLLNEESKIRQTAELYGMWADAHLAQKEWPAARRMGMRAIDAGGRYPSYFRRMESVETALGDGQKAGLYAGLLGAPNRL